MIRPRVGDEFYVDCDYGAGCHMGISYDGGLVRINGVEETLLTYLVKVDELPGNVFIGPNVFGFDKKGKYSWDGKWRKEYQERLKSRFGNQRAHYVESCPDPS